MAMTALLMGLLYRMGALVVDIAECMVLLYETIWKARDDQACPGERLVRAVGHLMLLCALLLCASHWGWENGLWAWLVCVLVGSVLAALLWRSLSRRLRNIVPAALVLGLSAGVELLC